MSTTFWRENILVRRKGEVVATGMSGDDCLGPQKYLGDRRSRQIARRHWVHKASNGWSSGGTYWNTVTTKVPGTPERHLRKPVLD